MIKLTKVFFLVFLFLLIIGGGLFITRNVQAATLWDSQNPMLSGQISKAFGGGPIPGDVRIITANIVSVFLSFIGLIFLILIIYAGFRWMTAGGNEAQVTDAQNLLKRSIIGIIIIFSAWVISVFVSSQIEKAVSGKPLSAYNYNYEKG